jgi:hypothetical protein
VCWMPTTAACALCGYSRDETVGSQRAITLATEAERLRVRFVIHPGQKHRKASKLEFLTRHRIFSSDVSNLLLQKQVFIRQTK